MKKLSVVFSILFLIVGCSEDGNEDSPSEVNCSSATGLWTITGASCDTTVVSDLGSVALFFNSQTTATQTQGDSSCSATFDWDLVHGSSNSVGMTGNGNLRCTSSGTSVASCSGPEATCDDSDDVNGFINNFETCALSGSTMILRRTVSSENNPNSLSFCSSDQVEEITLTQSATTPTEAVLEIGGSNPTDFGAVAVGGDNGMILTVSNAGLTEATGLVVSGLSAPFGFVGGSYPGASGDCGATLAAGASCNLNVTFAPTVLGGFVGQLNLGYSDGVASQELQQGLTGSGISSGSAVLDISGPDPFNFGPTVVGATSFQTFTMTNSGGVTAISLGAVSLGGAYSYEGGSYPGSSGTCGTSLGPGLSCTLVVQFAPGALGAFNASININYNDGESAQLLTHDLQGTGVTPALLSISPSGPFNYGSVAIGNSSMQVFTLTNSGGFMATGIVGGGLALPFNFNLGGPFPGAGGDCGTSLFAGSSCSVIVEFSPIAPGPAVDTLEIDYSDGLGIQQTTRDLIGTGF